MSMESIRPPRYQEVYAALRGWIVDGTYPPGSRLPSEAALCEALGVSKVTTTKALNLLVQEKLLVRIQGKGTFVVDDIAMAIGTGDMDQMVRRTERLYRNSRIDHVEITAVTGSDQVCADLQIPAGSKVQQVAYVRLIDEVPVGYRISHVPLSPRLKITPADVTGRPLYLELERRGVALQGAHHIVGACPADEHVAKLLDVRVGEPLVRIRLIVLDEESVPIERSTAYYRADRYEHHAYLSRHQGMEPPLKLAPAALD